MGFLETALGGEQFKGLGRSIRDVGGAFGAAARDIIPDTTQPSVSRPGVLGMLPQFENLRAYINRQPQPAEATESPINKAISHGAEIIPDAILSTVAGPAAPFVWPVLAGARTYEQTGSPLAAATSAAVQSVVPAIGKKAAELTASGLNALRSDALNVFKKNLQEGQKEGFADAVINRFNKAQVAASKGATELADIGGTMAETPSVVANQAGDILQKLEAKYPGIGNAIAQQGKVLGSDFLTKDRVMKAIETLGSAAGATAYLEAIQVPELLQMTPEQRNQSLLDTLVGGTLLMATMSVPDIIRGQSIAGQTYAPTQRPESQSYQQKYLEAKTGGLPRETGGGDRLVEQQAQETSPPASIIDNLRSGLEVVPSVLTSVHDLQVLDPVVGLIPVDVVNKLGGKQAASEMLLHNYPVFRRYLFAIPHGDILPLATATENIATSLRATTPINDGRRRDSEVLAALQALQNDLGVILGTPTSGSKLGIPGQVLGTTGVGAELGNFGTPTGNLNSLPAVQAGELSHGQIVTQPLPQYQGVSSSSSPVIVPPPRPPPKEAPLNIGDQARVMNVDSVLAKTQTLNGIRYELFNAEKLKDNRATIRLTDLDSGNTITLRQYPTFNAAELEFNKAVSNEGSEVAPAVQPARPAPSESLVNQAATESTRATEAWGKHAVDVVEPLKSEIRKLNRDVQQMAGDARRTLPETKGKSKLTKKAFLAIYGVASMDEANALYKQKTSAWAEKEKELEAAEAKLKELAAIKERRAKEWSQAVSRSKEQPPLSAPTVPNVPTSNVPSLVDSQPMIDRALSEGGGSEALKAVVPHLFVEYGNLPPGVPMSYQGGIITISKPVMDVIASRWPNKAQAVANYAIGEELIHAVFDVVSRGRSDLFVDIGRNISSKDLANLVAARPELSSISNESQRLYAIGHEFMRRKLQPELQGGTSEENIPFGAQAGIDPKTTFGQKVLAAFRAIYDYLVDLVRRLGGKNALANQTLARARQRLEEVQAGGKLFGPGWYEQGEPLNAKAISDMLKSHAEMTAEEEAARQAGNEIGRPTAAQAMGLAKAGEVLAAHPLVRQAVAATQQAAAIQPTTPEERHIRNVARGILANPIVSKHLAEPVAMLDAAIEMTDGDLTTFEDVLRDPASTDEMKGAAAGNAKETLMAYDEAVAHFDTKYKTDRDALMEQLQKGAETEFDAAAARDVAGTLFKQFQELGQQIVNQTADQAARSALKQAEDHSATSMKVLNFLSKTGILDGLTHDDNRSIQDLMGYIQRYMLEHRQEFSLGTTPDTIVTDNIGVGLDAIRDVLNIVRLSEPLRTAIAESKNLASGEHYKAPLNAIKNKVLDAISKGNLETAHNIYEKGIVAQGITLKESRDVVNFYAPKSAKILTAVRSLDGAKAIIDALQKDPALARQRKEVYDFLNIREITHSVGATSIKFKSTTEGEPDTAITWEGTPADYQTNLKAARNLLGDYASYIAMADAGEPGYSPAKAAGLKQSAKELQDYTDPAQDPRRGTLIPGVPGRFTEYLGSFVNHPELVPKYLLPRLAGPLGDMVNKTAQAFSDVKERPANLATNLTGRRRQLLRAALDSHRGMRPWQYRKLVFNPTVASMQNFSDPGQLRVGDPIGNGQHVTKEDLAYIDHIRAFQNEVFATVNNYGKHRFAATARGFAGILFDGNGMVRFPYARGPRMLSRRFPPDLVSTIGPAWRAATTPETKARVIDSHLTDILLSYVRGANASDYGRPYKYRLPFKQIVREFEEQPLTTFDDFVDRVTTLVNQDSDATAVTRDDVHDDLLGEINGFIEAGMKVAEDGAREDQKNPKVHITVVGGNNEMNSPREQAILPPGMYDYGIVSEDELASFLRDASISHGNAHLESAIAFLSELTRQIQDYKNQARNRNVPISTIRQESHEAMLKGQQRYSLQAAESLKEVLDAYVTRTENEIRDSANPWMKERPHQVVTNPIMRAIITSIVSPLKPFFRNFVGGGQQIVILNKIMRNLGNPHALASGGKQMIQGALKELVFLGAKATHPGTRRWRAFLEDPRGRAVVSGIAKAFMDVVRERQGLRDLQLELGTTTNANILERLRGQWDFASTGGRVTYDEPGRARRVVNRLATMLNMYSEGLGATFLGYMDARLNGVGPYITQKVVQDMKATALAYGDKLGHDGLYPDEALSAGWGGWGASNQAAQLRQMWRTSGWGVLDRTLSEYYNKVMAARAREAQQGLPPGTLEDKVELLTPEQTNQMYVGIPEDINMPTRQSRTGYWKSNPVLKPFGWLLQWGTTWLQKLLGLTQVLNNQPFLKRHGAILPLMISVGILVAIMGTMQTEISSHVIGRVLEGKVTNFPTLFDAVTPGQAASAVLAATADTIPVYGDALNMLTGTGFKRGFDVNSTFLLMNLASDVLKTSKEIYQSGAIGRPLLQFASRYTYPFNQLSARFPSVSGLRDLTNARNILTMGAKGTGLETKLRKPGGGISDQNYTVSTPLINDVVNAIGNGDQEAFQKSFNALVEQKRSSGSLNPQSAALSALRSRNPITSVFGSRPDPADLEKVYTNLPGDLASRARDTIGRFNAAIASVAPVKAVRGVRQVRAGTARSGGFGLRHPKVRLRMPRLSPPRLRRLAA
jgi:hypothetical protein